MSFDEDPNDEVFVNAADFALMCDEIRALQAQVKQLESDYLADHSDWLDARVDLQSKLSASERRNAWLREALQILMDNVDQPPESNCSCHISPPCSDCIEYSCLREAFAMCQEARAVNTSKGETK